MAKMVERCDSIVNVRLSKVQLEELKVIADAYHWSLSKLIRKVLSEYVREGRV